MISLQCCRKECRIPKDIQHILTGRNEECLPLMHFDAVDICFTSETHYHNKRVYMIVYLCRHLYHDTINIEIRTVDKLEGHRDRYRRTVTNVNNPETSHIQYCLCRFRTPRHYGEARKPLRCYGMSRLSPFGR